MGNCPICCDSTSNNDCQHHLINFDGDSYFPEGGELQHAHSVILDLLKNWTCLTSCKATLPHTLGLDESASVLRDACDEMTPPKDPSGFDEWWSEVGFADRDLFEPLASDLLALTDKISGSPSCMTEQESDVPALSFVQEQWWHPDAILAAGRAYERAVVDHIHCTRTWKDRTSLTEHIDRKSIVFHIPHASNHIPEHIRPTLNISDKDLDAELLRLTDWYTDELFFVPTDRATSICFPASRLVVDPERFDNDDHEPMSSVGMGVIYTRTSDGRALRNTPTDAERHILLSDFYTPHHERLSHIVAECLASSNRCLIVDMHSFPNAPLPCHETLYGDRQSPDICIGTDDFHTPEWLASGLENEFRRAGWTVDRNHPFAGSIVPFQHYQKDRRVLSVMIEVNRKLYMNEMSGSKLDSFGQVQLKILNILDSAIFGPWLIRR